MGRHSSRTDQSAAESTPASNRSIAKQPTCPMRRWELDLSSVCLVGRRVGEMLRSELSNRPSRLAFAHCGTPTKGQLGSVRVF